MTTIKDAAPVPGLADWTDDSRKKRTWMTKEISAGNVSLVQIILGCVELRVPETRSVGKSNRQVRYEYETPQR